MNDLSLMEEFQSDSKDLKYDDSQEEYPKDDFYYDLSFTKQEYPENEQTKEDNNIEYKLSDLDDTTDKVSDDCFLNYSFYSEENDKVNDAEDPNNVVCHFCYKKYNKSECFIMKEPDKVYVCINCAIIKQINKRILMDWEEDHTKHDYPRLKRCNRCGKYKNKSRFKSKIKYCSYCSLKKKLSYSCRYHNSVN